MIYTEWDLEGWMLRCQEKVFHRYTGIPHIVAKRFIKAMLWAEWFLFPYTF